MPVFIMLLFINNSCSEKNDWQLVWGDEFNHYELDSTLWTFDLGTGAPTYIEYENSSTNFIPSIFPKDSFSVRWEGLIKSDYTGEHTFYTVADDGVKLYVDDELLIDNWELQPPTEKKGVIFLTKKKYYSIKLEYFENSGSEAIILGWENENFKKQLITSKNLKTNNGEPGLEAIFYKSLNLKSNKDEVQYRRIDEKINYITGGGWGNNEKQYYTNRKENIRIENGNLVIEARKEPFLNANYTSARIKTRQSWKYGRFEIRAKLPKGRGTWSAIWALPTNWSYGGWPLSGEIDIMEHVGHNENDIVTSIHNATLFGNIGESDQHGSIKIKDACNSFHNYILEWYENKIIIKIDDIVSLEYPKYDYDWTKWPFDKKFHLIFNIAVGGWWGGQEGIDDKAFPTKMEIDYIRIYSKPS